MDDLRVGTRLWVRSYGAGSTRLTGWSPREIIGDTRVSWIIGRPGSKPTDWDTQKVKKRNFQVGPGHTYVLTEGHKAQVDWMNTHAGYSTGGRVQSLRDYETLKRIVDILDEYEGRKRQERDGQR